MGSEGLVIGHHDFASKKATPSEQGTTLCCQARSKKFAAALPYPNCFLNKRPVMGTATLTIGQFRLRSVGCGSPTAIVAA